MAATATERVLAALSGLDEAERELAARFVEALARKRSDRRAPRARIHHHHGPQPSGGPDAT